MLKHRPYLAGMVSVTGAVLALTGIASLVTAYYHEPANPFTTSLLDTMYAPADPGILRPVISHIVTGIALIIGGEYWRLKALEDIEEAKDREEYFKQPERRVG